MVGSVVLDYAEMNVEPAQVEERPQSSKRLQVSGTLNQGQAHPPADALSSAVVLNPLKRWWEAGWFKEWERVARCAR